MQLNMQLDMGPFIILTVGLAVAYSTLYFTAPYEKKLRDWPQWRRERDRRLRHAVLRRLRPCQRLFSVPISQIP
jgi:hypothetical protein